MSYEVLARKYRPTNFDEVIGQDHIIKALVNSIDQNKIHDQVTMRHPVYDLGVLSVQKDISLNNGDNRTWFSGAWMKNGFHEDGLSSGLDVARSILAKDILPIAAE